MRFNLALAVCAVCLPATGRGNKPVLDLSNNMRHVDLPGDTRPGTVIYRYGSLIFYICTNIVISAIIYMYGTRPGIVIYMYGTRPDRVFIKYCVFFARILENLPPLPRQQSAAIGCTKNYQPIGVTVHSHCVENFEGLL